MSFRIPKQHKPVKEKVDVKLERALLETLDEYCQYLESDRDYVVASVLQLAFKKDKGFASWRASGKPASEPARAARG